MKYLREKRYWIWLSLIEGLGAKRKQALLEKYKTPEKIYSLTEHNLLENVGIGEKIVQNILNKEIRANVDRHIKYMQKYNIDIISIDDKNYPQILRRIYDYPVSLYVKGNAEILNNSSVAIVGCRDASEYGKNSAKYFSYNLAKQGKNIISGLAKGIDSYAHIGNICAVNEEIVYDKKENKMCIKTNLQEKCNEKYMKNQVGRTIAVVGNGLDMIYPNENKKLAEEIIKTGGAIISEYPLGTKPSPMNFPARNRIISGMSNKVIVVEAKEKSGTLITVDFALEQGRDVFVVPGNINLINSIGTNELIKQGAQVATTYLDVLK